jgi:hypothetical protein
MQFLCYFVVINASEGSLCFQNFVAAIYDGDWFLGKIIDIGIDDINDGDVKVSFIEKKEKFVSMAPVCRHDLGK